MKRTGAAATLAPVLVLATLYIPNAVVFESTLSFLGLGIQPPTASWGNILATATNFYTVSGACFDFGRLVRTRLSS